MDEEVEIKQGFLCPLCMEDLGELERLHQHVDIVHSTDSNTDTINMIKGMFAKAKSKLNEIDFTRNLTGQLPSADPQTPSSSHYGHGFSLNAPQVLGATRGHTDYFVETQRDHTEIATVHTNTLIIRLDKLLHDQATVGINRKDFEKRTVPWADDSDYTNCRVCNAKFSLTKRKHHCRLCGKIICATCSKFLSFLSAQKITSYVSKPLDADVEAIEDNENYMRICAMCKEHLQRYELRKDLNSVSSVFIDLYAKLTTLITQINNLTPSYRRMAMSLQSGESLYTLESATQLKKKIVYIQSEIKNLSERIEKWGLDNDPIAPRKPTHREMVVQGNIRAFALMTLQEVIMNMPEIPTPNEYERLHQLHKEKVMNREKSRPFYIEDDNRDESDPQRRSNPTINRLGRTESTSSDMGSSMVNGAYRHSTVLRPSVSFSNFPTEDSWAPTVSNQVVASHQKSKNPFLCDDDEQEEGEEEQPHPFAQQYLILKSYLNQAVQSGRLDEAEALKQSLDELEEELKKLGLATPRAP